MLTDTELVEAASLTEVEEAEGFVGRRYKVRLIEGDRLGSSGYYPAETLLRDGPRIFKKGTPMFLDHQTPEEREAKPFGSMKDFAGELAEDAYYDGDGLYAEINVFDHQIPLIKSLKDKIGISIRAKGKTVRETIDGKAVPVFKELIQARSADFVIKAGAGGKIVSVLESAVEDSGATSEAEEGRENMDEVLKAIEGLRTDFGARLTTLEEAAKPVAVENESEEAAEVDYDKVLEIAEAFVNSSLDADGRSRVLDLHKANKKPLSELIEAEEAYVKAHTAAAPEVEGVEESAKETDAEESASGVVKVKLPTAWGKKVN